MSGGRFDRLNAIALVLAIGLFASLGFAWWRDRARHYEPPRWSPGRFVPLAHPEPLGNRELWLVAVNPECPHCQHHLRALAARIALRPHPPALAALVVDQSQPPRAGVFARVPLPGGAWWDRSQVWRESWGRRAYGETFRFDRAGTFLSSTPVGIVPDSAGVRMN